MASEKLLSNEFVSVTADLEGSRPSINFRDLTDMHNEPCGFTRGKRGLKMGVAFIKHLANVPELKDDLKMYDIVRILDDKFNLKCHTYCAMD